jgi:hypothetical protein
VVADFNYMMKHKECTIQNETIDREVSKSKASSLFSIFLSNQVEASIRPHHLKPAQYKALHSD